ncbi:hypothetical protein [Romboutsia timonensis]|uniref:hypothetical protein n=1 Tax=Romboutsia timonensis TaxID=1776391 RepID=UPI002A74FDEB|nr:hypothetical protein [Romboutsia timonensis]MCI6669002.1 hypothetical protein [Romboutsia timonensis]MDY3000935.1 hypothetical protein [Romboutsia timonensis]MDY3960394.1 hypothetical protein [Romboutsia timonensis]
MEDKDVYEVIDELIKNELENNINISEDEIFNKELENNFKLDEEFKNRIKLKVKKSISNNKNDKYLRLKKLTIIASIVCILTVFPLVVKAIVDKVYNYVDTTGQVIKSDSVVYKLENPITKNKNNNTITLESFVLDTKDKTVNMKISGIGQIPKKDYTTIKIGNENIDTTFYGIGSSGNEWKYEISSNYNLNYSNENIEVSLDLDDKTNFKLNFSLIKSDAVSSYKDLGPSDTKNNVEIVSVVKEEGNLLDVNFISSIEEKDLQVMDYGNPYNYNKKTNTYDYEVILRDKKGKEVEGKIVQHGDRSNNFTFDTSNMEKPYKIIIPKITLAPYGVVQSSKVIKLPIPKNGETINLNKEVVIENNRDYGFNNENNSFKIKKIKRYDENIRIYLDFNKNNKVIKRRTLNVEIQEGVFGNSSNGCSMTFTQKNEDAILDIIDVTPKNINKRNMKIKFSDGEFVLYGPWEMEIK